MGQAAAALASPFLTRIYTPADLGKLALFLTFVNMAATISTLKFEFAIVPAKSHEEALHVMIGAFAAVFATSITASMVFAVLIKWNILGFGSLPMFCAIAQIPFILAMGGLDTLRFWFVRNEMFSTLARVGIAQNFSRAVAQVALGVLSFGWMGLLIGEFLGRALGLHTLVVGAWESVKRIDVKLRWTEVWSSLKANSSFPKFLLPSSVLNSLTPSLIVPFLSKSFGGDVAGQYALVMMVLSVPLTLIGNNIADVFHGRVALVPREQVLPFTLKTAGLLLALGSVPLGTLYVVGVPLFALVFGPKWAVAGTFASIMVPWALAQLVVSPLSRLITVFNALSQKLYYDLASLALITLAIWVSIERDFTPQQSIGAITASYTLAYIAYFIVIIKVANRFGCDNSV